MQNSVSVFCLPRTKQFVGSCSSTFPGGWSRRGVAMVGKNKTKMAAPNLELTPENNGTENETITAGTIKNNRCTQRSARRHLPSTADALHKIVGTTKGFPI